MSTLIQCPSCNQKFNMQGKLPAIFTCTKCKQPMDLTGFPGYVPEPAAAPARAGAGRVAAPEPGGGRSSRRRARDDDDDGGERRRPLPQKKAGSGVLIATIVGGLAVIALVLVLVLGKDDEAPKDATKATAEAPKDSSGAQAPEIDWNKQINRIATPDHKKDAAGNPLPTPATPAGGTPAGGTPSAGTPAGGTPAKPEGKGDAKPAGGAGLIQVWNYPEDVTPEERQKIDKALETALNDTGISQREAEAVLVGMKRKAIWRLVSEFKHIQDTVGYESRPGKIRAMIVDRTLRKIDGFMERRTGYKENINSESTLEYMTGVAKRWNGWLETGMWKDESKPWDVRVDVSDEPAKDKPARSGGK